MDARCFVGDHDFDTDDVYDLDAGEFRSPEQQMRAKCIRCGQTLEESINLLLAECEIALGKHKAQ